MDTIIEVRYVFFLVFFDGLSDLFDRVFKGLFKRILSRY